MTDLRITTSAAVTLVALLLFSACGAGGSPPTTTPVTEHPSRVSESAAGRAIAMARGATDGAVDAADLLAIGWRKLPRDHHWRAIVDASVRVAGSRSLGTAADGKLLGGVELAPEGPHHSVIDDLRKYDTRWGTTELVRLIERAAEYVHRHEGGAPLRVGELSKRGGGDLRWHRSHNSGRDVDFAFYMVDAQSGASVPAPRQIGFDGRGNSAQRADLRFDVARNWRLVEGLLAHDDVTVQRLFVSRPIKALLLTHAASVGADPEIVRRAEAVMHQPVGASSHANHFHLRIACSRDDRVEGCADDGPLWAWADWHRDALLARALALAKAFDGPDRRAKLRALELLVKAQSPFAADVAAVWGFWDADPKVRDAAVRAVVSEQSWSPNVAIQAAKFLETPALAARHRTRLEAALRRNRDALHFAERTL